MKATLLDLFTSKKFLAALAAVIIYVAGRFGFDVDPAALDRIFAALLVYVGAQGVADAGKSAAQVRATADVAAAEMTKGGPLSAPPSGLAKVVALLVVLGLAGSTQLACATVRPVAGNAVTAELDCTSAALVSTVKSLGNAAEVYLASKIAGDGRTVDTSAIKADLKALGSQAWSCALSVALHTVLGAPSQTSIAHAVGPRPDWSSVVVEVKAGLGVTSVRLPDGTVL